MGFGFFSKIQEKALEKTKAQFKAELRKYIEELKQKKRGLFHAIYISDIKAYTKHDIDYIDEMIEQIPIENDKLIASCKDIEKHIHNNLCFINFEEYLELIEKRKQPFSDNEIADDIMKALPVLGAFYDSYQYFYIDYSNLFDKIRNFHICEYGFLNADEEKLKKLFSTTEDFKSFVQSSYKMILTRFRNFVDDFIKEKYKIQPNVNIREGNHAKKYKIILSWVDEDELLPIFSTIWVSNMRQIAEEYIQASEKIDKCFDNAEKYMQEKVDKDFSFFFMEFPSNSHLLKLDALTNEECQRVLKLYTSGVMTGSYSKYREKEVLGSL